MKLKIEINLDNAAFGESEYERDSQIYRILSGLNEKMGGEWPIRLKDSNGNSVGLAEIVGTEVGGLL